VSLQVIDRMTSFTGSLAPDVAIGAVPGGAIVDRAAGEDGVGAGFPRSAWSPVGVVPIDVHATRTRQLASNRNVALP
jgi:hypothetical protein